MPKLSVCIDAVFEGGIRFLLGLGTSFALTAPVAASMRLASEAEGEIIEVRQYTDATSFVLEGTITWDPSYGSTSPGTNTESQTFVYAGQESGRLTPGDRVRVRTSGLWKSVPVVDELRFVTDRSTGRVENVATSWIEGWYASSRRHSFHRGEFLPVFAVLIGLVYVACFAVGLVIRRLSTGKHGPERHLFPRHLRPWFVIAVLAAIVALLVGWVLYVPLFNRYLDLSLSLAL